MKHQPQIEAPPATASSAPPGEDTLAGYALPYISPAAERILILAFVVLIGFTSVEAPLRYGFAQLGAVWLIYLRDLAIIGAMLVLACQQFWRHQLQTAFIVFAVLIVFHGIVGFLLCGVPIAVLIGLKTLLPFLFGAV